MDLRLDSANWDIQSTGGDKNYYTYDASGTISLNIRKTASVLDSIKFSKITSDSLTWTDINSSGINWIKYSSTGYNSRWSEYETITMDTLNIASDSIKFSMSSQYLNDQPSYVSKIGYYESGEYMYKFKESIQGIIDTTNVECTELQNRITCKNSDSLDMSYTSTINGNTVSDTLWFGISPNQSWYYTVVGASETIKKSIQRRSANTMTRFFDLLGRNKSLE